VWVGKPCALWAIDHDWCWRQGKRKLPPELYARVKADETGGKARSTTRRLLGCTVPVAVPLNPLPLDQRLAVQQGVFLCPLALDRPFMDNLGDPDSDSIWKVEIVCSKAFLREALWRFHALNIGSVSLFPGVDGLARSLQNAIAMPQRFLRHRDIE
jgi:hypothetical protein